MADKRRTIAKNIALMLNDGDFVNLGIGIPTLVANYIPEDVEVILHAENGFAGQDKELHLDIYDTAETLREWLDTHGGEQTDCYSEEGHRDLVNAGGFMVTLLKGASCFDSVTSFVIARGGHLNATVLGGLQVDRHGNLANWMVPGKKINGVGGAMDLAAGSKKVIVAMEHVAKDGAAKLVENCTMPLTAKSCVSTVVTDLCIVDIVDEQFVVKAMAPGVTREELQEKTEATLIFSDDIAEMAIV